MSETFSFGGGGKYVVTYVEPGTVEITIAGSTPELQINHTLGIVAAGPGQLFIGVDGSNSLSLTVSAAGAITYNASGASAGHTFSDPVTVTGLLSATGGVRSSSASVPIGYATGAGGAVTQITSRATGVTMVPNPCTSGTITTDTTSLAGLAAADFIVTNSAVAIGDVVLCSIQSGSNGGNTDVTCATVTNGTFTLRVSNHNAAAGAAETGALLINFIIVKAVSA